MNLQRYVSTVYSEQIKKEYYSVLDKYLNEIYPNLKYEDIRKSYTKDYIPYTTGNPTVDYCLHNLLFEKTFGNTMGHLIETQKQSILLFPIFQDIESQNRLKDEIKGIYTKVLGFRDKTDEFKRDKNGNCVMFIPIFSDEKETPEECKERLTIYLNRWYDFIIAQKPLPTNVRPRVKFDTICYTVDQSGDFFTSYYSTKLKAEHAKVVQQVLSTFLERLGLNNRSPIKDPILQLTPETSIRKFKADGQTDMDKLNLFIEFLKQFIDVYKKTNDKAYLKSATGSELQTLFRIYYRINNTDSIDEYEDIRPGSSYVYKLTDSRGVKIGYFIMKNAERKQYLFREYTGLTSQYKENEETPNTNVDTNTVGTEYVIETKKKGNVIYFKRIVKGDYKDEYNGTVEPYLDLHIYEKYKWFDFRDMDGSLTSETKIRFYDNILFDKKSLIQFLKSKGEYKEDTKLNIAFLRINQSNSLLLEYVEYILKHLKKSHVYVETLFSGKLESFIEKNKRSIVDLIFQTNRLLYTTQTHSSSSGEKKDISKNYKMVSYQYYAAKAEHFDKVLYDMKEGKFCDRKTKCKELIQELKPNSENQYAIVIVDITKDNVEVESTLKAKTYCKKIRRTLKRQLQPFLRAVLPRVGGTVKRQIRRSVTRRRKYRH